MRTAAACRPAGTSCRQETASASEAAPATDSVAGYQYYDEDGKRASGWRTIEGVEGISEEGETYRFYFKNGKPYAAASGLELFSVDSKKVRI